MCRSESKFCNILFAKELAKRTDGSNLLAVSVDPGAILTNLPRHIGGVGPVRA
jgi:NAD(P)-dependent dehydrogenase (short-subunit alcohol dehydrogenase family)